MFTCNFEPSICRPIVPEVGQTIEPKYKGTIVLKPFPYEERLDFAEAQASAMIAAGDDADKRNATLVKFTREFSKNHLADRFVSSDLTRISDGYVFDTLEKIKHDEVSTVLIPEIMITLMSGNLSLGK